LSECDYMDVPLQAQALARLSNRERARYRRALSILASGEGVRAIPLRNMSLAGLGVFEALLAQSWKVRFSDPQEMVHTCEIAADMSLAFPPKGIGSKRVADLQARAWGELANAYRSADQLRISEHTFGEAFIFLTQGTGDPYLRARLLELEASLYGALREFASALRRLESVSNIYRDLGETHLSGRSTITRALYTSYRGFTEEALRINSEGLAQIDRHQDPVLYMMGLHNHVLFLVDLERYSQARRVLFEHRRHIIYNEGVGAVRLRGLEGRISYGFGELKSAEIAFREAKDGLLKAELKIHAAVLALELSMVLLSQGKFDEAEQEVISAREIFLSLKIYRELVGSIIFLEECFRRRDITPDLIESTVALLWRRAIEIVPRRSSESPRLDDPRLGHTLSTPPLPA
jgi:tetratricopeptide (TPR) repeat protein